MLNFLNNKETELIEDSYILRENRHYFILEKDGEIVGTFNKETYNIDDIEKMYKGIIYVM